MVELTTAGRPAVEDITGGDVASSEIPGAPAANVAAEQQRVDRLLANAAKRRRRGWAGHVGLAAMLVVLPAIVAYALANLQTPLYEARVEVVHHVDNADFGETPVIMANQTVRAERRDLAVLVADELGVDADELVKRRSVSVRVTGNNVESTVLRIAVRNEDPGVALDQVQAYAEAYLEDLASDGVASSRAALEDAIGSLEEERLEAKAEAEAATQRLSGITPGPTGDAERAITEAELDRANNRYDQVLRDLNTQNDLLAGLGAQGPSVSGAALGAAFATSDPVEPQPLRNLALGLALGLVLGATYLFVVSQLRRR